MDRVRGNELVEFMRFGIGWRMAYEWDGDRMILHRADEEGMRASANSGYLGPVGQKSQLVQTDFTVPSRRRRVDISRGDLCNRVGKTNGA